MSYTFGKGSGGQALSFADANLPVVREVGSPARMLLKHIMTRFKIFVKYEP